MGRQDISYENTGMVFSGNMLVLSAIWFLWEQFKKIFSHEYFEQRDQPAPNIAEEARVRRKQKILREIMQYARASALQ